MNLLLLPVDDDGHSLMLYSSASDGARVHLDVPSSSTYQAASSSSIQHAKKETIKLVAAAVSKDESDMKGPPF